MLFYFKEGENLIMCQRQKKSFETKNANFIYCLPLFVHKMWKSRYIEVKVAHYFVFMFSPPKISYTIWGIKAICLHLLTVFYLTQPFSKQIICFDFQKTT